MRSSQRNFVVEFKSRSRKPKVIASTSIWGDTDLKAISRELEETSDDPFAPPVISPTHAEAEPPGIEMSTAVFSLDDASVAATAALSLSHLESDATTEDGLASAADSDGKHPPSIEPSAGPAKRRGKAFAAAKTKAPLTPRAKHRQPAADKNAKTYVPPAALEDLIAENTRLKAELRERLTADNRHLREMLARFL